MLAHQIKNLANREVTIFDTDAKKRALARAQGFSVIDAFTAETAGAWATILGACQAQFEQKRSVPENYIFYQEAANLLKAPHLGNLARDFEEYVFPHREALHQLYFGLHPDSQARFLSILKFRLSSDPADLSAGKSPNTEMWLDIPTSHRKRPYTTFLDVGAFDGDTLRYFRNRFGCERGIAVEANTQLFDSIRTVGQSYPMGIALMPMAAWSKETRLKFEEVRFGMMKVSESSEGELEAAPIDNFVSEQVDCIKMDIEGAEAHALEGCRKVLERWQPDLAIAAYHRPDDLVTLRSQIDRYGYGGSDFAWHIGHYSDCLDDSIFYVIRK